MEECLTVAVTTIEANGVEAASTAQVQTVLSNTGIDRRSFTRIPTVWEMPDLVQVQIESFDWFKREGLRELLEEISPISDHHKKMGEKLILELSNSFAASVTLPTRRR
jgi:DNA-directed RNA polymerase beta subunit